MRWSLPLALSLGVILSAALPARAQDQPLPSKPVLLPPPPGALTEAERRELDAWLDAMRKWQKTDKKWHNEPVHDPFGRIVDRGEKPDPPAWLAPRCAALAPDDVATMAGSLGAACRLIAHEEEDPTATAARASTQAARAAAEKVEKDSFLTRVHIDGLWITPSTDVRLYGLVGSHISLVDVGRVQFFGPPGVILLSVPDGNGSRRIRAGYTWGISVRLKDVRMFSPTSNMTLFLTVSKVWINSGAYDRLSPGGYDIAGFSLAPRKHR